MQAHDLKPAKGSTHAKRRVGRGNASGTGTFSGRGSKGQKARGKVRRDFEGGQTRLLRRLPHRRGFTNHFRKEYQPVNLRDLERFEAGSDVTAELLKEAGIIDSAKKPVKVLATGEITHKLTVHADRFSLAAKEKIEAVGGTVDETEERAEPKEKKKYKDKKKKKGTPPKAGATAEADEKPEAAEKTEEKPAEEATEDGDGG
jgi:large subunit ribosomal protein L15